MALLTQCAHNNCSPYSPSVFSSLSPLFLSQCLSFPLRPTRQKSSMTPGACSFIPFYSNVSQEPNREAQNKKRERERERKREQQQMRPYTHTHTHTHTHSALRVSGLMPKWPTPNLQPQPRPLGQATLRTDWAEAPVVSADLKARQAISARQAVERVMCVWASEQASIPFCPELRECSCNMQRTSHMWTQTYTESHKHTHAYTHTHTHTHTRLRVSDIKTSATASNHTNLMSSDHTVALNQCVCVYVCVHACLCWCCHQSEYERLNRLNKDILLYAAQHALWIIYTAYWFPSTAPS